MSKAPLSLPDPIVTIRTQIVIPAALVQDIVRTWLLNHVDPKWPRPKIGTDIAIVNDDETGVGDVVVRYNAVPPS